MKTRFALLFGAAMLPLSAASAPLAVEGEPIDLTIRQAHAEAQAAQAEVRRLEQAAAKARSEAERLAAEQQAAAVAIAEAEARISAADAQVRLAEALVNERRERLAQRQAPLSALLAGIVSLGRRPPLLSIADSSSLSEFVRVRALLDTTLPVIRTRTAALATELAESRRLEAAAEEARRGFAVARQQLESRQRRFAALERDAAVRAERFGASAVGASDVLVASSESEARLKSEAQRRRDELALAADLAALPPTEPRPGGTDALRPPLAYRLPLSAELSEGVGSVSDTGIRSRGLAFRSNAGMQVTVPADGTIVFAGAFRRHDGVVIIDHGGGWKTVMTGVRTQRRKGERVGLGEPLGVALGPVAVELSTNGTPVSAALIAGSSHLLSIKGDSG